MRRTAARVRHAAACTRRDRRSREDHRRRAPRCDIARRPRSDARSFRIRSTQDDHRAAASCRCRHPQARPRPRDYGVWRLGQHRRRRRRTARTRPVREEEDPVPRTARRLQERDGTRYGRRGTLQHPSVPRRVVELGTGERPPRLIEGVVEDGLIEIDDDGRRQPSERRRIHTLLLDCGRARCRDRGRQALGGKPVDLLGRDAVLRCALHPECGVDRLASDHRRRRRRRLHARRRGATGQSTQQQRPDDRPAAMSYRLTHRLTHALRLRSACKVPS